MNDHQVSKESLPEYQRFAHLSDQYITLREAATIYNLKLISLYKWTLQPGLIKTKKQKKKVMLVNQADVAYCSHVYHKSGGGKGKRIFNSDGTPFKPKTSDLTKR